MRSRLYSQCAGEGCNPCALVHLSNLSYHLTPVAKIGDKIVETLSLNGVTFEDKTIRTHPAFPPFKVGVFVV